MDFLFNFGWQFISRKSGSSVNNFFTFESFTNVAKHVIWNEIYFLGNIIFNISRIYAQSKMESSKKNQCRKIVWNRQKNVAIGLYTKDQFYSYKFFECGMRRYLN